MKNTQYPNFKILSGFFSRYKEINAVCLFGSYAEGRPNPESDIDLAVITDSKTFRRNKLAILEELALIGFENVDLSILDTDDILLKFEAVRHNKPVYVRKNFDFNGYFSLTIRQYFDFLPYLDRQREALKNRILYA